MPIRKSTFFRESELAHRLLDGLKGLEIGGSAHNSFGLDTLNVDRLHHEDPLFAPYASEQINLGGEVMPVDIVAPGNCIPVDDQSFDFVISSHVIEHFYDPIWAIKEWMRIARQYIFITFPHRDALESDRPKPITQLSEHIVRFDKNLLLHIPSVRNDFTEEIDPVSAVITMQIAQSIDSALVNSDEHHSRWTLDSFLMMCEWIERQEWGKGWTVYEALEVDDKVGNGCTVVLKRNAEHIIGRPAPALKQ